MSSRKNSYKNNTTKLGGRIKESETKYRALFEDAPISLWEEDFTEIKKYIEKKRARGIKDFRKYFTKNLRAVARCAGLVKVVDVNKATLKIYKAKSKKEFRSGLGAVFSKESLEVFKEELVAVAEGKTRFESEAVNKTLSGEEINVSLLWVAAPNHEKTLSKVFVSIVDVTRRKKAEEALRESEEMYKTLVETDPDAVTVTDLKGNITHVSRRTLELHGFKNAEELIGKNSVLFIAPEDRGKARRNLQKTLKEGFVRNMEYTLLRKDGTRFIGGLSASLIKDAYGKPKAFIGTTRDITQRKRMEEALKASEKKYSTLVEKGNDGIIIIQDGLLKFVNPPIAKITGFSKEEAVGKPFTSFVSPEYKKLVLERYKKRLKGEKVPEKYEIEIVAKNGTKIPVEISASLIEHEGRPADMAILRDITERKEVEKILEEEKKKMETIFKTTEEGLALYDKEGRIVDVNPAFEKLFGLKESPIDVERKEVIQNEAKFHKYKIERFDDPLRTQREVYSGKPVPHVLIKIHSHPPRYLEGNYVPIKDKQGDAVGMSASFRDVTVLKSQAEKIAKQLVEVERQKNRWEAVFGNVEEGVLIMDRELHIISANAACELMSGCTEKEMVGKKHYDVFGCHDRTGRYFPEFDPLAKVLATKEPIPYDEHLHCGKNGDERWVGVSYTPIVNENGRIEQMVGVIRDITAIKELEKAKSEFVSVASHELRTPLTVVNGYLSLLLSGDLGKFDDPGFQANLRPVLDKVYNETQRLTKLVQELLNVSRIEDGRIKLTLRKVSVIETIDEVVKEFGGLAEDKGIRLVAKYNLNEAADSSYVMADKDKLKQILVNLIDNAIKYTDVGGKVTVECFLENGLLHTQVKDTGVGIPANMLPRIFEKFQQGPGGSYLKENKGTGLGLFVVKSLVELHKGKIWVDSTVGKGAKFTFALPGVAAA